MYLIVLGKTIGISAQTMRRTTNIVNTNYFGLWIDLCGFEDERGRHWKHQGSDKKFLPMVTKGYLQKIALKPNTKKLNKEETPVSCFVSQTRILRASLPVHVKVNPSSFYKIFPQFGKLLTGILFLKLHMLKGNDTLNLKLQRSNWDGFHTHKEIRQ